MDMLVDLPGGLRVDAHFAGFTVHTDQPIRDGGDNTAPGPFNLFLASLATCAGYYILAFCRKHEIATEGITLAQRTERDRETGLVGKIYLDINLPPGFPEKYKDAVIRSADQCAVKKHLAHPPQFEIRAEVRDASPVRAEGKVD